MGADRLKNLYPVNFNDQGHVSMVRRINEKLIILVKYLSGFGSAEIHLTAEVKVKGFALVVIGWGTHAHCYEIVIGLAGFWHD